MKVYGSKRYFPKIQHVNIWVMCLRMFQMFYLYYIYLVKLICSYLCLISSFDLPKISFLNMY